MSATEITLSDGLLVDILRGVPEAVIYADLKGIIRYWNRGAEEVFGFLAEEAVGQSLDIIIPERMRQAHWDGYNMAIERGDTLPNRGSRITRSLHKSAAQLYVDMSFAMVKNRAGEVIGSLAVARDTTERFQEQKNLRKQLAELTLQAAT